MPTQIVSLEIARFMRSSQGRMFLESIRTHLEGRRIERVDFTGAEDAITTVLHLDNGQHYRFNDEELMLQTLENQFSPFFRVLSAKRIAGREG
jgi:hypothetical protein